MRYLHLMLLAVLPAALLIAAFPAQGQAGRSAQPHFQSSNHAGHVSIEWTAALHPASSPAAALPDLPEVEIGGVRLPARLVTVRVAHDQPIRPQLTQVDSQPWMGDIPSVPPLVPQPLNGEPRPALAADTAPPELPAAPLVVLREGRINGERLVVLALSPIFAQQGQPHIATRVRATVPAAQVYDVVEPAASQPSGSADPTSAHTVWLPLVSSQPTLPPPEPPEPIPPPGPRNPAAQVPAVKVFVSQAGMQRISGQMLADAGFDPATLDAANLHLWHAGREIPLERLGTSDGFNTVDEIRFYAPPPGDRWNATDVYWLTSESEPGQSIATRDAFPGGAPLWTTGQHLGTWRDNTLYDSTLPGPDGDHWYARNLLTVPGQDADSVTIDIPSPLPLTAGDTAYTLRGTAYTPGPHTLEVQMGGAVQTVNWTGTGTWQHKVDFVGPTDQRIEIRLLPGPLPSGVELDSVDWNRPVRLDVANQGATFTGYTGVQRYELTGVAAGSALYDISQSRQPTRLNVTIGSTTTFEDGTDSADSGPRRYLLTGAGTLHTPTLALHGPTDMAAPLNTEVLYIAPGAFHAQLAPLVAQRESQGYSVAVLDVQALYDAWSYGHIAPDAIRDFLRYAAATWDTPPVAVTLVGDGTYDPFDYMQRGHELRIPPYLAMVDPWIGETACDTCYVRLDGEDPRTDLLPDLYIGRIPVKSPAEVTTVVNKIIGYENGNPDEEWRRRTIYLADNAVEASGQADSAGDFAAYAEQSIAQQPASLIVDRLYYDPSPTHPSAPWREPDHRRAHQRTMDLFNQGAGTLTFFGHSNHWQWALTSLSQQPSYLLGLLEVDNLRNGDKLPVVLAMTCLSSAFHEPAYSGTTIDERLVLHPGGGAVAVWGPTGRGVVYGHTELQRGFYRQLWDSGSPGRAPLGTLARAGYLELFTRGNCCEEALYTFTILGDPLTRVQVKQ